MLGNRKMLLHNGLRVDGGTCAVDCSQTERGVVVVVIKGYLFRYL
jgi:hypothetical protein